MAAFNVFTLFTAKDGMSNVVTNMTRKLDHFNSSFSRVNRMGNALHRTMSPVNNIFNKINNVASSGLGMLGIGAGFASVGYGLRFIISETSKLEDATARFQPLMGSLEKSKLLVDALNKAAASTPYQFEGIADVTSQLLPVMNGDIEKTIKTFKMLGDTAGGKIEKLDTITRGYTKALLKGKPDLEALNMIGEAGVPIFEQMAKTMGVSTKRLFELSKQGKLTNADLTKTFENMTSKGGLFFNGMEIASKTLSGRFSTMKDNIAMAAANIGTVLTPILGRLMDKVNAFLPKIMEWVTANKQLIGTKLESFFEAMLRVGHWLFRNWNNILAVIKFIIPILAGLKIAIIAVNIAMAANPIGLIIVGVFALAAGIALLIENWDAWSVSIDNFFDKSGAFGLILLPLEMIWEIITSIVDAFNAFSAEGFIGGIMQIGKSILSLILLPMEKILQAFDAIGLFDVKDGLKDMQDLRKSLEYSAKENSNSPEAATRTSAVRQQEIINKNTNNNNNTQKIELVDKTSNGVIMKKANSALTSNLAY